MSSDEIEGFDSDHGFDLVVAEGFLYTLPNRDEMVSHLCSFLNPGGLGVVSFNDRCGGLMEFVKRAVLWARMRTRGHWCR